MAIPKIKWAFPQTENDNNSNNNNNNNNNNNSNNKELIWDLAVANVLFP